MRDWDSETLLTLIGIFAPLSLVAIGGGGAILAPMAHEAVNVNQWFSQRQFIDYFAISRAAPGPGAMVVALVGWHVAWWPGAFVSVVAMFLPSSILCFYIAKVWNNIRGSEIHKALEVGLAPIGIGFMAAGAVAIMRASDTGPVGWLLAIGSTALLVWRSSFHPLAVIAVGGFLLLAIRGWMGIG
ncbi:MAG: hypothetical protein RLZ98_790 [Pseudomonadota bacterium]|jgi:chromate transporter